MNTFSQLVESVKKDGEFESFQKIATLVSEGALKDDNELLDGLRVLICDAPLKGLGERYGPLAEQYLYRTDKPFVSARVLVMLCSYMYEAIRYQEYIKDALRGHTWDTDRDLQSSASGLAEKLFAATQDPEIICLLIQTLNSGEEKRFSYTYDSLLNIAGVFIDLPWRTWVQNNPKAVVDWDLVKQLSETYNCAKNKR